MANRPDRGRDGRAAGRVSHKGAHALRDRLRRAAAGGRRLEPEQSGDPTGEVAADESVETEPVDSPDEETKVADEDAAGALEGRGSTQLATVFPNRQAMELTEVREVFVSEDGSEQTFRRWQPNGSEYRDSKEPPAGVTGDRLVRQFLFRSAEVYFVTNDGVDVLKPVEFKYRADGAIAVREVINDGGRYGDGKVYQDSYVEARFDEPRQATNLYLECTDGPETFHIEIHNVSLEPGHKTEPRIYSLDCLRRFGDVRRRAWHCEAMDHISGMAYTRVYQQDDPPKESMRRALISMVGWKSLYAQAMPLAWPKITTEPIRRTVVTPIGEPVAGATVVSHTRRHWVRILEGGKLHDQPHGSATTTDARESSACPSGRSTIGCSCYTTWAWRRCRMKNCLKLSRSCCDPGLG